MTEYEAACLMDATARLKAVPLQSRMIRSTHISAYNSPSKTGWADDFGRMLGIG